MQTLASALDLVLPSIRKRGSDLDLQIDYMNDRIVLRRTGKPDVTMISRDELEDGRWKREWHARLDGAVRT